MRYVRGFSEETCRTRSLQAANRRPETGVCATSLAILKSLRLVWRKSRRVREGANSALPLESLLLVLGDQFGHFGVGPHRLDQNNVSGVQVHPVGSLPFVTAPDQDVLHLFGFLIHLTLNVIDIGQNGVWCSRSLKLAKLNRIVIEQNGLVGRIEPNVGPGPTSRGQQDHGGRCSRNASQN